MWGEPGKPSAETLLATIKACVDNGRRLEDESYDLEFREPPYLQYYVLLIAQEELAKAFMLCLIRADVIPFNSFVLRAMNDHACKQLVGLIMDYIIMRWDTIEQAQALVRADVELGDRLPPAVESAVALLRFEKIGRWESRTWDWVESPEYDALVKKVAEGKLDRQKQDALYVRVGRDGRVIRPPPITATTIEVEKERLSEFRRLVESLLEGREASYRYERVIAAVREMFNGQVR